MTASPTQAEVQAKFNVMIGSLHDAIVAATALKGEIANTNPDAAAHCQSVIAQQPLFDDLLSYKTAYDEAVANG